MHALLQRQELFRELWDTPFHEVATRNRIPVAELQKACEVMCIPVPPADHWAKFSDPTRAPRPRLPEHHWSVHMHVWLGEADIAEGIRDRKWLEARKRFEEAAEHRIDVAPVPAKWHRALAPLRREVNSALTEIARKERERATRRYPSAHRGPYFEGLDWHSIEMFERNGRILMPSRQKTVLRVTPETASRALAILNALCTAAKARDIQVQFDDKRSRLSLGYETVRVEIRIMERLKDGWIQTRDHSTGRPRPVVAKVPTGILVISIDDHEIADAHLAPLEGQLHKAFLRVYRMVVAERQSRRWLRVKGAAHRDEVQREVERAALAAELEADRLAERQRRVELLREARNWERSELIRRYIGATTRNAA